MATKHTQLPHLRPSELTLMEYAVDDSRDIVTLSDQEALILQLSNQVQEQQLEKALLESGTISILGVPMGGWDFFLTSLLFVCFLSPPDLLVLLKETGHLILTSLQHLSLKQSHYLVMKLSNTLRLRNASC